MKKTRKILAIILVIALLVPFIPFKIFAFAQTNSITITFRDGYNSEQGYVEYSIDDGASWVQVTSNVNNQAIVMAGDNFRIRIVANDGYQVDYSGMSYREDTDVAGIPIELRTDTTGVAGGLTSSNGYLSSSSATAVLLEMVEFKSNDGGGDPIAGGPDDIEFDAKFTKTHMCMWINNKEVMTDYPDFMDTFTGTVEKAGYTDFSKTNELRLIPPFGDALVTEYIINGVSYTAESENVTIDDKDGGFIIVVPGADKYTIRGEGDTSIPTPKTIIWVNPDYVPEDAEDAKWVSDFTISHGTAKVVEVYDENGNLLKPEEYIGEHANEYGLDEGFGWVSIMPGSRVIFEFVPEYGYQLTGIAINEMPLDAIDSNANRFEIKLPNEDAGNLHFAATFTKTDDILKTNSKKIEGGSILLGENTLDGGSAQLSVNDVELSADKIVGFENAAGDYKISNYLDLDLYQVFYKGKDDSDDVWLNKISELDK